MGVTGFPSLDMGIILATFQAMEKFEASFEYVINLYHYFGWKFL